MSRPLRLPARRHWRSGPLLFPAVRGGALTAKDMSPLADAYVAGFNVALRLTPEQETLHRTLDETQKRRFAFMLRSATARPFAFVHALRRHQPGGMPGRAAR